MSNGSTLFLRDLCLVLTPHSLARQLLLEVFPHLSLGIKVGYLHEESPKKSFHLTAGNCTLFAWMWKVEAGASHHYARARVGTSSTTVPVGFQPIGRGALNPVSTQLRWLTHRVRSADGLQHTFGQLAGIL